MVYVCFVDAVDWQAFITGQCDDGRSSVRLCGLQNGRRFCVNDLLVCNEYAAVVGDIQIGMFLPTLICNIFLFFLFVFAHMTLCIACYMKSTKLHLFVYCTCFPKWLNIPGR